MPFGRGVDGVPDVRRNTAICCQPFVAKIFHFTEIRICRMCRPSQPTKGAVVRRHERGLGLRWTRAALKAGSLRAGRDEPREHATNRDRRTALLRTAKPCGPGRRCYGQAFAKAVTCVNRRSAVHFAEVTEARRNSSPGRARHKPSDHRAGKAWSRLPCVSPVHCVCICSAWGSCGCQPAPGLPCALSSRRGEARGIARANHAARLQAHVRHLPAK